MKKILLVVILDASFFVASFISGSTLRTRSSDAHSYGDDCRLSSPLRNSVRNGLILIRSPRTIRSSSIHDTPEKELMKKVDGESNFWFSRRRKVLNVDENVNDHHKRKAVAPWFTQMDTDGRLPESCYQTLGLATKRTSESYPETCMVGVALDLMSNELQDGTSGIILKQMQKLIDSGLTTFQLKGPSVWGEEHVYGKLRQVTPPSVMRSCNLVLPLSVPDQLPVSPSSYFRERILQSLHRSGGEAIDTLQIQYNKKSRYHLDAMEVITDLQRDGYVRSMIGYQMPPNLIEETFSAGFDNLDGNQISMNLLSPESYYSKEMLMACENTRTHLVVDGALAGGLLSPRRAGKEQQMGSPYPSEFRPNELNYINGALQTWAERQDQPSKGRRLTDWELFQTQLMPVLSFLALKYRVSEATIAMRWVLQQEQVASVVVGCSLPTDYDMDLYDRPKQLRAVFSFELEEDDLKRLWDVAGCERPSTTLVPEMNFEDYEEGRDGLYLPGTANSGKSFFV